MEMNNRNGGQSTSFSDKCYTISRCNAGSPYHIYGNSLNGRQQRINVNLSRAKANALNVTEDMIVVSIDNNNCVYINSNEVPLSELSPKLLSIYQKRKNKAIFLKADKNVVYGDFVRVVSIIKSSGVEQLEMITEGPKKNEVN